MGIVPSIPHSWFSSGLRVYEGLELKGKRAGSEAIEAIEDTNNLRPEPEWRRGGAVGGGWAGVPGAEGVLSSSKHLTLQVFPDPRARVVFCA